MNQRGFLRDARQLRGGLDENWIEVQCGTAHMYEYAQSMHMCQAMLQFHPRGHVRSCKGPMFAMLGD